MSTNNGGSGYGSAPQLFYTTTNREGVLMSNEATIDHVTDVPSAEGRPEYLEDVCYTIALDTETTGFQWHGEDRPFLATVSDYDRDWLYYLPLSEDDDVPDQQDQLRAAIVEADALIFHNATFDILMLVAAGVVSLDEILDKEIHDTEILARVVNSREPNYRLKSLAAKYVDAAAADEQDAVKDVLVSMGLIRKPDQRSIPDGAYYQAWRSAPTVLEEYAIKDTRITYDLFYALRERASEDDLRVYEMERSLIPIFAHMEYWGIGIDEDRVADLLGLHTVEWELSRERLHEYNDNEPFDPNSRDELLPYLEGLGINLTAKTDSGEIRVDKGVLARYTDEPGVQELLDYRAHEKLLTTYLRPLHGSDVAHPRFIQIGAWTGRMSCRTPNFQNIPVRSGPEMRSMIVPRPGNVFAVADFSSIELRILAYYMNDDGLWDIINNGDPFIWLGSEIYGTADVEKWPTTRQALKNGFYAMTYGAGGPKLAQTIGGGMTAEEGRELRKSMENALGPAYSTLWRRIRKAVTGRGYVKTLLGRTQYVPKDKAYVGLNALIQGSSADVMKVAMARTAKNLEPVGAFPILVVHDELVVETPTDRGDKTLDILMDSMVSAGDIVPDGKLPLAVDGTIAYNNYGEAK